MMNIIALFLCALYSAPTYCAESSDDHFSYDNLRTLGAADLLNANGIIVDENTIQGTLPSGNTFTLSNHSHFAQVHGTDTHGDHFEQWIAVQSSFFKIMQDKASQQQTLPQSVACRPTSVATASRLLLQTLPQQPTTTLVIPQRTPTPSPTGFQPSDQKSKSDNDDPEDFVVISPHSISPHSRSFHKPTED